MAPTQCRLCISAGCTVTHTQCRLCISAGCTVTHTQCRLCISAGCTVTHTQCRLCISAGCTVVRVSAVGPLQRPKIIAALQISSRSFVLQIVRITS